MTDPHMPGAWVGYEPRDGVIWQGAKPHGPMTVGRGKGRYSAVGCAVCAVAEACCYLGIECTPLDVQTAGLKRPGVWAPGSSGANIPELVRAQGLTMGEDRDGPGSSLRADELRPVILEALAPEKKGVVLCGIDYKGSPVTDHWALAYSHDGVRLHMADPATADHESVGLRTLTGQAVWAGVPRAYRVARVITVFR